MQRKTIISGNPTDITYFIDPRTGSVLREGNTPTNTISEFKKSPKPVQEDETRLDKLENSVDEIKNMLKEILNK